MVSALIFRKFSVRLLLAMIIVGLIIWGAVRFLPLGFPDSAAYFEPMPERRLQSDEIGQLRSVTEDYFKLSLSGDDFADWNTEQQDFWKYSIAFAAYGLPSAMIIDPDNQAEYKALMDMMIWKMKSKKVWGDFTDRGFGADPISVQNIMYKGHLNLMYGLYQMSTGDVRYAREFTWLTQQIADEMRLHHEGIYEGVTCEPNAWFVECNTISMLSLHIYDRLYGTAYTSNEIQWSLDFIMKRMRDPETGLFYRAYLPNHDLVKKQISGYANAWILTFLTPFTGDELDELYPSFKENLVEEFGPYAAVLGQTEGDPDQVAQIFGLWAAKEFNDPELFGKLRNAVDKFGRLGPEVESAGLAYDDPNSVLINGVIVASKMHLGWQAVLDYDWGYGDEFAQIPDVSELSWRDILPTRSYAMGDGHTLPTADEQRACPACFWGDFKSIRMQVDQRQANCPTDAADSASCGLESLDESILERDLAPGM
ncbi:hypothetical protein [Arenicella xantha]|uniref:Linalool dehydratase/isomerase domain-containing protein n=1 Tax=Arenicella xantha TaxID=644221 RepID=A0A395JNH7_9GAMM|nr:hypothetical protein [Arenicella xantha]RBP51124.1 hypothetical protein DFR28_102543 [Arenicella xantha]